jgi:ankyrin repeat protein
MNNNLDFQLLNAADNSNYQDVMNLTNQWANINIQNPNGITPLMYGCMRRNIQIVDALILMGADLNIRNHRGQTALMVAIENYDYDIMLLLMRADTDLSITDDNNERAIDYYNHYFDLIHQHHFALGYNNNEVMNNLNPFNLYVNINNIIVPQFNHLINNQINAHNNHLNNAQQNN